jgi:hypothetical protein
MPSPYESIGSEQREAARELSSDYLRGTQTKAQTGQHPGAHILDRTTAPSASDLKKLESSLRKAIKVSSSEAERYTKGYSHQLTPNQTTFLNQMLAGDTLIHAYKTAYPNDKSATRTLHTSAYHLSNHPVIVAAMDKQALTLTNKQRLNASAIREYVIDRLLIESREAFTDSTRVRALELLGKVAEVGMFVTRTETTNITVPAHELQATLLAKLRAFFENPPQPLATLTDRRQGLTIDADEVEVTAEVRQSAQKEQQSQLNQPVVRQSTDPPAMGEQQSVESAPISAKDTAHAATRSGEADAAGDSTVPTVP